MIKLKKVEIDKYKSFLEKQEIDIEDGVTRVVGKNESGKTALLEAIAKFNYFDSKDETFKFDKTFDYPRGQLKKYQDEYPENDFEVIRCTFEISDELLNEIEQDLGKDVFIEKNISIAQKYNGGTTYSLSANDSNFIKNFLDRYSMQEEIKKDLLNCKTLKELEDKICEDESLTEIYDVLKTQYISNAFSGFKDSYLTGYIAKKYIEPNLPKFLYFDEYYSIPGTINLNKFAKNQIDDIFTKEQNDITKALFELSNIDINKVMDSDNYEEFISELEATSNNITDKLLEYWSTNQNLEISFDIQTNLISNNVIEKLLQIRIKNTKHRVTLPLRNRSKGFIWFFSFLVWFSRVQEELFYWMSLA